MSTLMIVAIVLGSLLIIFIVGDDAQLYFSRMIRGLQQINAMPLMNVVIPANVMMSNSILNSALNFDVIAIIKPWELVSIKYSERGGLEA